MNRTMHRRINSIYKNSNYFIKRAKTTAAAAVTEATCIYARGDRVIRHLHAAHVRRACWPRASARRSRARVYARARVCVCGEASGMAEGEGRRCKLAFPRCVGVCARYASCTCRNVHDTRSNVTARTRPRSL